MAHRVVRRRGSHIFLDNCLKDGGDIVSLTRRPPFTPRLLVSVRGWVDSRDIVLLEYLDQSEKKSEPAIFRFVA
jgi:hypothetical protein